MVFAGLVLAGLLAQCLWVLGGFSFDFFVGFCAYGVAVVVGGFTVVGLW